MRSANGQDSCRTTILRSILWRYDMFDRLKAYYHHTASSSVLVHGDYVYVCTGNGRYLDSRDDTVQSVDPQPGRVPQDDGPTGETREMSR